MELPKLVRFLQPYFITGGDFARAVQSRVRGTLKSRELTASSQAVTDADFTVQNFFEAALLAEYPEVGFYGEEESRNTVYFPSDAEYVVTLDPINHTLHFQDGLPNFDMIGTVLRRGEIVAAVVYVPFDGKFFIAIKGEGVVSAEREAPDVWKPFSLPEPGRRVMLYDALPLKEKLQGEFEVYDLVHDYRPPDRSFCIHAILQGKLAAYMRKSAHILDWGAIAFIVEEAGGAVCDLGGNSIPSYWSYENRRIPSLLVCANKDLQQTILSYCFGGSA